MKTALLAALAMVLAASHAFAGPAADLAQARIAAIAAGDLARITQAYGESSVLHWVGGPLDGTYTGAQLAEVWTRFGRANGQLRATVANVTESVNPRGATVVANVQFAGQSTIKVRYVLVYREGRLVNEIWQIDPNLAVQ